MSKAYAYTSFPQLYSFITYRPERFGALVYNSMIGRELELNQAETKILRTLDGTHNLGQIIAEYQKSQLLPSFEADQRVIEVVSKLNGIQSLNFHSSSRSAIAFPSFDHSKDHTNAPYYSAPKNAVWDITYLCNLKCPHCLTSSGNPQVGELTTQEAYKLIDNLASAKLLSLSLSGGEPFLRKDLPKLIRYATSRNIRTDIASNGVAMDDATLEQLRDLPLFHIQISLDGIGEKHDRFRGWPGAFHLILENIKRLKKEGISVSISTTATSENLREIPKLIDLAWEIGCTSYKAIPFLPAGRGAANSHLALSKENYQELCQILLEKAEEYKGRLNIASETTFSFQLTETYPREAGNGIMGCSASYDTLSIGSDGTAYPCPFFQTIPLGNLMETPLTQLWQESPPLQALRNITKYDLDEPCQSCNYAPDYCRGGCRASAYMNSGRLTGCDSLCPKFIEL